MRITNEIRAFLLNIAPNEGALEWKTKRTAELGRVSRSDAQKCSDLVDSLSDRNNSFLRGFAKGTNLNPAWQLTVIEQAASIHDLPMLKFFDKLMSPEHGADLLRVVFNHANNFGVDTKEITADSLDAYVHLTKSGFREFDIMVHSVMPEVSDELIYKVLSDTKFATSAVTFLEDRELGNPQELIDYLDEVKDITPSLSRGYL